jgi:hypothetical protein
MSPPTGTYISEPNQTYKILSPKSLGTIELKLSQNGELPTQLSRIGVIDRAGKLIDEIKSGNVGC